MRGAVTKFSRLFWLLLPTILVGALSPGLLQGQATDRQQIDELIEQLADRDFEIRQAAERTLVELGPAVLDQLDTYRHASDNELRLRAVRIAGLIRRRQMDLALQGFLNGENELPGWQTFASSLGDTTETREAYAGLFKRRQSTLAAHESPEGAVDLLVELLKEYEESGARMANNNSDLMACLSMQILKTLPLTPKRQDRQPFEESLARMFSHAVFDELVSETNEFAELHRASVASWLQTGDLDPLQLTRRISVANRLELAEGLGAATECLQSDGPIPSGTLRFAMQIVTRHGDSSHVDLFRQHLENKLVIHTARFLDKNQQQTIFQVQVRDMALAAMIYLLGENYRDYGLNALEPSYEHQPLPVRHSGFVDEQERTDAHQRWKQFLENREKNNPDSTTTRIPSDGTSHVSTLPSCYLLNRSSHGQEDQIQAAL